MVERKLYIEIYKAVDDNFEPKSFREIATLVSHLFWNRLPKIKTRNTKRINIELCSTQSSYENIYPIDVKNADIIQISTLFDFKKFEELSLKQQEESLLKTVYEQLVLVFERLEVDTEVLRDTYNKVLESNFTLTLEPCGAAKLNRNKKIAAKVTAEYFIGYTLLSVVFLDKEANIIQRVKLFNTLPSDFIYLQLIQNAKWIDNEIFQVFSKTKKFIFNVNINGTVNTFYNPVNETTDDLKKKILFLTKGEVFIPI
jgi:hypothetical protein